MHNSRGIPKAREGAAVKPTLKPGLAHTRSIIVDEARVISFMGDDCRVYATPRIISDVEYACRDFLLAHLDPGEDSVGTKVNWEHVGPALLGVEVTISIKLLQVEGRRVTFEASVADGADPVAHGMHERFIVDVQKVRERLLKKKAQRG
jgi:fluoroacetyl-CoA thioesterase